MLGKRIRIIALAFPPAVRDDVRSRHPAAEHHRLPSGGHFPYLTRSAAYNNILVTRLLVNRGSL
ncbi:MAG: hypothetical protein O2967_13465 [Proteobacteria bacterium]|nr:hypothetical protein [Pseudomonadota bacterium]